MSQELFGEAHNIETINKKKKENQTGKMERELSHVKLYTINLFRLETKTTLEMGWETFPPPSVSP